ARQFRRQNQMSYQPCQFSSSSRSQLDATNFPADGFGQFINEFDFARVFVRGGDLLAMLLQLMPQVVARRAVLAKDHECLHDQAADWIGFADDRCLDYGRMLDQSAFDLERPDAIAGTLDHVITPRTEVSDENHSLGLTVAIENRQARGSFPASEDFGIKRFAGTDAVAQFWKSIH